MKKMNMPYPTFSLSIWPILLSMSILIFMMSMIKWLKLLNLYFMMYSTTLMILIMWMWWRDILRESIYQGKYSKNQNKTLKISFLMFIISEYFFFMSFFWCNFHMMLSPSIEIGSNWPPKDVLNFNPYEIPLMNTLILLSSGTFMTWSHYSLMIKSKSQMIFSLMVSIFLGLVFMMLQYDEYKNSKFCISDSTFGSIFFMMTGFHGFHVLIGTLFLTTNLFRILKNLFSEYNYLMFEMSSWYWHFVDMIWLFLYIMIYYLIY